MCKKKKKKELTGIIIDKKYITVKQKRKCRGF